MGCFATVISTGGFVLSVKQKIRTEQRVAMLLLTMEGIGDEGGLGEEEGWWDSKVIRWTNLEEILYSFSFIPTFSYVLKNQSARGYFGRVVLVFVFYLMSIGQASIGPLQYLLQNNEWHDSVWV